MQDNAKPSKPDRVIKKPQVCQKLVISQRNLAYKMAKGEISYFKIGGSVRFLESDVDDYIASNRVPARADRARSRVTTSKSIATRK